MIEPRLKTEGIFKQSGSIMIWITDDAYRFPSRCRARLPSVLLLLSSKTRRTFPIDQVSRKVMPDLLDLETYNYQLPGVDCPVSSPRQGVILLHLDRQTGDVSHLTFRDIVSHINPGEVLILNSSKVIPAFGRKDNGTQVEVLLLNKLSDSTWRCMVHPGKRLKTEQWIEFSPALKGFVSMPDEDGLRRSSFPPPKAIGRLSKRLGTCRCRPIFAE